MEVARFRGRHFFGHAYRVALYADKLGAEMDRVLRVSRDVHASLAELERFLDAALARLTAG